MLWYCAFTWYPSTTREQVAKRVVQQHDAGKNYPERIRGWYNLAGGGSGFLLVETDDPRQLTAMLQPSSDLVTQGRARLLRTARLLFYSRIYSAGVSTEIDMGLYCRFVVKIGA